jgi:hypothetical protein
MSIDGSEARRATGRDAGIAGNASLWAGAKSVCDEHRHRPRCRVAHRVRPAPGLDHLDHLGASVHNIWSIRSGYGLGTLAERSAWGTAPAGRAFGDVFGRPFPEPLPDGRTSRPSAPITGRPKTSLGPPWSISIGVYGAIGCGTLSGLAWLRRGGSTLLRSGARHRPARAAPTRPATFRCVAASHVHQTCRRGPSPPGPVRRLEPASARFGPAPQRFGRRYRASAGQAAGPAPERR